MLIKYNLTQIDSLRKCQFKISTSPEGRIAFMPIFEKIQSFICAKKIKLHLRNFTGNTGKM